MEDTVARSYRGWAQLWWFGVALWLVGATACGSPSGERTSTGLGQTGTGGAGSTGGGEQDGPGEPQSTGSSDGDTSPATDGDDDDDDDDDDDGSESGPGEPLVVWPNDESFSNSDPWIAEHHDEIERMRPRVLALNYVNARSMQEMTAQLEEVIDVIAESTRYHGYDDAAAPAFLEYELAYAVDLRDAAPDPSSPYRNSSLYPRENPVQGAWGFDYEVLFSTAYADLLGLEDPDAPGENLTLCQAIDAGLVHEVWVYGDADVPDVSAAEMLELKPNYDEDFVRVPGAMNRCAGNGCFDEEDIIPCTRSVRVAWFNNTRGPGCFMESISHAFEGMGRKNWTILPYLSQYFPEFAGMRLDDAYGAPVADWYACPYDAPCLSYPSETSVSYDLAAGQGTIQNYDPVCGNVHWPPNARSHYDLSSTDSVRSSCTHYRDGSGETAVYDGSADAQYADLAPDCMGPFLVWWRQNIPGLNNVSVDDEGLPMRNWWPFMFY